MSLKSKLIINYSKLLRQIRRHIDLSPVQYRMAIDQLAKLTPGSIQSDVAEVMVARVPCKQLTPQGKKQGTILYFHGGAFAFGSFETHNNMLDRLCLSGFEIIFPEYGLTPEFAFPHALEQCWQVFEAMPDHAELIIGGDSAGGNLAVATAIRAGRSGMLPNKVFLLSPWLDLSEDSASMQQGEEGDSIFGVEDVRIYSEIYRDGVPAKDVRCSPLLDEFEEFPPTLIQATTNELIFNDSKAFAAVLQSKGIPVTFQTEDKLFHSWQLFVGMLDEADKSVESIVSWLKG